MTTSKQEPDFFYFLRAKKQDLDNYNFFQFIDEKLLKNYVIKENTRKQVNLEKARLYPSVLRNALKTGYCQSFPPLNHLLRTEHVVKIYPVEKDAHWLCELSSSLRPQSQLGVQDTPPSTLDVRQCSGSRVFGVDRFPERPLPKLKKNVEVFLTSCA